MYRSIDDYAKMYKKMSLWIIAGLSLILLVLTHLIHLAYPLLDIVLVPLIISAVFTYIIDIAYDASWRSIAKAAPENLNKFYLAASVLHMMAALMVIIVGIFILRNNKAAVLAFVAVFSLYYVVQLVFNCIFFARIAKKHRDIFTKE